MKKATLIQFAFLILHINERLNVRAILLVTNVTNMNIEIQDVGQLAWLQYTNIRWFESAGHSAVQTPGFSPPAPAPAKKTPAPGKKLRLRQKTCEN